MQKIGLLLLALALTTCAPDTSGPEPTKPGSQPTLAEFAVALPEPYAAEATAEILRNGGNAIDAAITAAFALAVTFPQAGNIGGGGFLLTQFDGQSHFLDYRETAPAAATRDMYQEEDGSVDPRSSLIGARAAGTPGTVAGMWEVHQKFGSKPWADLLAPAIKLARDGYEVQPQIAGEYAEAEAFFAGEVNFADYFAGIGRGGIFMQPELAATLERIAAQGPDDFYRGETAQLLVAQMQRSGGLISLEDLDQYQPVWRAPLSAMYGDYEVVSAPPPSSGGFAVIHLLTMKQLLAQEFADVSHNSARYVHLIAEMEKRVFADRAEYFGDPDFVEVPMEQIMAPEYIASRAAAVNPDAISPTEDILPGLESKDTRHYSIVDAYGNAVSNTYTVNWTYGSGEVVEGAGFLLNNEMDDFSTKPGVPNIYGVVGGTANEISPGKRMLSSMSPTIVLKQGHPEIVVGSMGGSTIFTTVFQVIVNLLDYKMSAQESVDVSRFHHQLLPKDLVTMSISRPLEEQVQTELREMGYRVEPHGFEFGDVQVVARNNGKLEAAADARGVGKAIVEPISIDSAKE